MDSGTPPTRHLTLRRPGDRADAPGVRSPVGAAEARRIAEDLSLLAHPVRLQLLAVLGRHGGRVCVGDLEAAVPVKQPTVSHHLRLLREAGLIEGERDGVWAYYYVDRDALAALRARIQTALAVLG